MGLTEIPWIVQLGFPILATLQLLPVMAAVLVLSLKESRLTLVVGIALAAMEMLLAIYGYLNFDRYIHGLQFAEWSQGGGPFGYHVAVDGLSLVFILLTALLCLMLVIYGPLIRELSESRALLATIFATEATLIAMLATVNLLWFVLLSAIELGLIGFLLWHWGTSSEKDLMLRRFYQFMGVGILLLLAGTLMLGWSYADSHGGRWSFDLFDLSESRLPAAMQTLVFFLLFYGVGIRIPLFPLHGWLPLATEHGNIAVAPTLLLGVKVGIYAILRYILPLLPDAVWRWHRYVAAFATIGIFYAAILAMRQLNLRRLLAYAVLSHTSILMLGLFSLGSEALQGSVMLSITFGLALSTLASMTGLIFRRTHTTLLPKLGGLFDHIPLIGLTFLLAGLAIAGMPGTPGFDAAHLVLEGAIGRFGTLMTIAAGLGNVLAAGFLLWAFQRAFLTPPAAGGRLAVEPTTAAERLMAGLLVVVLLSAGFYSHPWLELIERPLAALSQLFQSP